MRIALFGESTAKIDRVYPDYVREMLRSRGEVLDGVIDKRSLSSREAELREVEVVFGTWGFPTLTAEEIRRYLPSLRAVFYAAGTVQYFAAPYLECGVRVYSAWRSNGKPVAESTLALITLAAKGYFQAVRRIRHNQLGAYRRASSYPGNYRIRVGLIGCGAIGSQVATKLRDLEVEVYVYDPYLSNDRAECLGVTKADLQTLFSTCHVVSNHLANKAELSGILNYDLFKLMPHYSTFINTGRGAQVVERHLARALIADRTRSAVLDVLNTPGDVFTPLSPLWWCRNCYVSPHIAGSMGQEVWRMSERMIAEFDGWLHGAPSDSEVTADTLSTMA